METATGLQAILRELREAPGDPSQRALLEQLWREPGNAFAMAALGTALLELGDPVAAIEALDRAHWLQPESPHVLYHYAQALLAAGRAQEARLRLEAALRLSPGFVDARRALREMEAAPGLLGGPGPRPAPRAPVPQPAGAHSPIGPPPVPRHRADLADTSLPARLTDPEPPDEEEEDRFLEWEPEPRPGFMALVAAAFRVWSRQPLLWLVLMAVPHAVAAAVISQVPLSRAAVVQVWTLALAVGTAPAVLAMVRERAAELDPPGDWPVSGWRLISGWLVSIPYVLVFAGGLGGILALRTPFREEMLPTAGLVLSIPFHALLAPALVLAATGQSTGLGAVVRALRQAGSRTWLHLAVMLTAGLGLGGGAAWLGLLLSTFVEGAGETVLRVWQVAGLSLAGTVWVVLVAVCGLDALPWPVPGAVLPDREA